MGRLRESEAQVESGHVFREPPIERREDRVADGAAMLEDVMAPEAQDRIAMCAHEIVAATVIGAVGMLRAVKLDDELVLSAAEVGEVGTDRMLANELMAG
jgi:hypothetical protein